MQMITYAGGEFLTGDDLADALLEYSRALGQEEMATIVAIPVREEDGFVSTARFLIGPASQIVTRTVRSGGEELRDDALVQRLRSGSRGVSHPEAVLNDEPAHRTAAEEY